MTISQTRDSQFWDRIASRYASQPVSDPTAYAHTLERTRTYLHSVDRVLELGCGTGSTALALADAVGQITATDYAPAMIDIARAKGQEFPNARFEVSNTGLNAWDNASFDVVLAFNLWHLVPDLEQGLKRAHEVLKPGGLMISKTACLGGQWYFRPIVGVMRLFGKAPFVHFLKANDFDSRIEAAGFEIVERAEHNAGTRGHFVVARKR